MKKPNEIKIYPLIVILGIAIILFVIKTPIFKATPPIAESRRGSTIQLDSKALEEALKDTCDLKLSKNKLSCCPELMTSIMQGVDSHDLEKVTDKSITFKGKEYIEVPAAVITNMVDLGLINKSNKEQCDGNTRH